MNHLTQEVKTALAEAQKMMQKFTQLAIDTDLETLIGLKPNDAFNVLFNTHSEVRQTLLQSKLFFTQSEKRKLMKLTKEAENIIQNLIKITLTKENESTTTTRATN